MTRLLVSIRSAEEAAIASAAGVDLIDVKEPSRGPLGAADPQVCRDVAKVVGRTRPLSAALGELRDFSPRQSLDYLSRYTYAKFGLAGCGQLSDWAERLRAGVVVLPRNVSPVAVIYADYQAAEAPPAEDIVEVASDVGCRALLIDTFDKTLGDVFAALDRLAIEKLLTQARKRGLPTVLAGSLSLASLPTALALGVDYVGVRGAVCTAGRESKLSSELVQRWMHQLSNS